MIRAIIIDDEKRARELLRHLLETHLSQSVQVVGEGDDVTTGAEAIRQHSPDIVFLDIQMHSGTGFDLLQQFDELNFEVIFITAFDQYAVRAFQFSAFGYLLKPIKVRELKTTVTKLETHIARLKSGTEKRLKVLVENYGDEHIRKLVISNNKGFQVSKLAEIIRLEGDRNYTHFILENGRKITTSKTLGEYEDLLDDYGFFRIHQSTIVNLRHVTGYIKGPGGKVSMSDGENCNVSRHRKPAFLERFR
ncbi:MAG: LytTR family DNA-binding domain-containing protein [Bacteroidota bacterium]